MNQPNILFVFPDQLSARWLESPIVHTPNLEQFATQSTCFQQAYTSVPLCTPYRACLLTGLYPTQNGVRDNGQALPADTTTLAHHLADAGYNTYYMGKWHLSGDPQENRWVPPDQRGGFQHFTGWESHHVDHWQGLIWQDDPDTPIRLDGHETDGLTKLVLDQLENVAQPFFMMVSYQAPHPPCSPPENYEQLYRVHEPWPEPNVDPSAWYHMPHWNADYDLQTFRERYFGEISHIDAAFGQLLQQLDKLGLADNTIVIFTSDHGEMAGAHGVFGKGVMYDEAVRVPLLVRMPRQMAGDKTNTPVTTVDFLPTLLELAGISPQSVQHEGQNFAQLLDQPASIAVERSIYSEHDDLCTVRGSWKLITTRPDLQPKALFNLTDDPFELKNLLNDPAQQNHVTALLDDLGQWAAYVGVTPQKDDIQS